MLINHDETSRRKHINKKKKRDKRFGLLFLLLFCSMKRTPANGGAPRGDELWTARARWPPEPQPEGGGAGGRRSHSDSPKKLQVKKSLTCMLIKNHPISF